MPPHLTVTRTSFSTARTLQTSPDTPARALRSLLDAVPRAQVRCRLYLPVGHKEIECHQRKWLEGIKLPTENGCVRSRLDCTRGSDRTESRACCRPRGDSEGALGDEEVRQFD